jgi:hypothetical protein
MASARQRGQYNAAGLTVSDIAASIKSLTTGGLYRFAHRGPGIAELSEVVGTHLVDGVRGGSVWIGEDLTLKANPAGGERDDDLLRRERCEAPARHRACLPEHDIVEILARHAGQANTVIDSSSVGNWVATKCPCRPHAETGSDSKAD